MNKKFKVGIFVIAIFLLALGFNSSEEIAADVLPFELFEVIPTKNNRLDGVYLPGNLERLKSVGLRLCRGEYEPISFIIKANESLKNIEVRSDTFNGPGKIFPESIDIYTVKVWYQAGYNIKDLRFPERKSLVPELLLKDDSLVIVDRDRGLNYLRVQDTEGHSFYINITEKESIIPDGVFFGDSDELVPFDIGSGYYKQIWVTVHVPPGAVPGLYNGNISVLSNGIETGSVPVSLEVLPFDLSDSRLIYSLYYHGTMDEQPGIIDSRHKTAEQLKIELEDMREHGVLYPTCYEKSENLVRHLKIRDEIGLPKDKLFWINLNLFNSLPSTYEELKAVKKSVAKIKEITGALGYDTLYVYGIDEAKDNILRKQRSSWNAVRGTGVKIFVATNQRAFSIVGDLLDIAVLNGRPSRKQAKYYHSLGNRVFSYHNPQVGVEDPEIYRRNFGISLFLAGFDGVMNYAYQREFGNIWNDFDDPKRKYRDHNFTYPTSEGIIKTIQWEGFREGVDDVRYLSTLLDVLEEDPDKRDDYAEINEWLKKIDPMIDLDALRGGLIDKLLAAIE